MQTEPCEHKSVHTELPGHRHDVPIGPASRRLRQEDHLSTGLKRSVWNTARHCFKINKQLDAIHISHLSPEAEEEEDQEFKAILDYIVSLRAV